MAVFFAFVAIFILFVMLANTRTRLKQAEATLAEAAKRIGALQRQVGLLPPKPGETFAERAVPPAAHPAEPAAAPPTDYERWKPKPVEAEEAVAEPEPEPGAAPVDDSPIEDEAQVEETPVPAMAAVSAPLPSISQDMPVDDEPVSPVEDVEEIAEPVVPEPARASTAQEEAPPSPPPPPPSPPEPPRSVASRFENLFGKTLPIWAGGITLAIAGVLIVRYAIDAGFFARIFTPPVQVVVGMLFGLGLIGGAEFAFRNEDKVRDIRVPQALSGAGLATLYAAILVAANVYALIGPLTAFIALAAITSAALGLSLRFGPPSALLGLAGGLAAPALVGATEPNIPLLSVYLGLTIAGLAGVSRMRRWPWLALAALVGGAGWSLFMVLATDVLDTLGSLSVGGFVLLLAIALPMLAFDGPRSALLRSASAIVGALQLALLVGYGGFTPLHWGLFALIAAAGQWLAWRDRNFAIVPTIGAALSVLLLAAWPDPSAFWFATIGLSLAVIHALPLLAHLWKAPPDVQRTWELCGIAIAAPLLTRWQFQEVPDSMLATVALGGALLAGTGMALGWKVENRTADTRFVWLTATAAALLAVALALLVPVWMIPLAVGAVAIGLLFFGKRAGDARIEWCAAAFFLAAIVSLLSTQPALEPFGPLLASTETDRLWAGTDSVLQWESIARWLAMAALATLFAWRGERGETRRFAQIALTVLAYGALAQVVPAKWLMLVPVAGGIAALAGMHRVPASRIGIVALGFAAISLIWAGEPLAAWSAAAAGSLAGLPMTVSVPMLALEPLLLRLLIPATLFGGALIAIRSKLPANALFVGLAIAGTIGGIALHALYRIGFASAFGSDFIATGLGQRLLWEALLIGGGWLALWRGQRSVAMPLAVAGTLHTLWYGLLLHNPLWSGQAVGPLPVANLLIPLFGMLWIGLTLIGRLWPDRSPSYDRIVQLVTMLLVAGFAWASLRQLFHGTLLVDPGVFPTENILRSILILAAAIGFLLWGIRTRRHDWRIASLLLMLGAVAKVFLFDASGLEGLLRIGSFVALGFSLIGIGWLYSRQLARSVEEPPAP